MPDKAQRYLRARESVTAVIGLWGTWEEGAAIRDKESGYYFDAAKVHRLNHDGPFFKIEGPLNIPRTPQGRPVIVQAGASEHGQELAAETADIVYAALEKLSDAKAFYGSVKGRLAKFGRRTGDLKVMPGLMPIIGATEAEAQTKYRHMQDMIDPLVGIAVLTGLFGDISAFDLDAPFPAALADAGHGSSRIEGMIRLAQEKGLTLRGLYQETLIANNHHVVIGTAATVADVMEEWFVEGGADGFNIVPAFTPITLGDFVGEVVPELQRRRRLRTRYEGTMLRDNMGLPDIDATHGHPE